MNRTSLSACTVLPFLVGLHNKNPDSDALTLGKFTNDSTSYTKRAGNTSYFDLGDDWAEIKLKYRLSNDEMFDYFNKPALDDAIKNGKTIRFSHDPRINKGFLGEEWKYIKSILNLTDSDLIYKGGFWYVK